jgi:AAA domain
MPIKTTRQLPPGLVPTTNHSLGGILDTGVESSQLSSGKINTAIYGRNGSGKTTFACQGRKPLALIAVEPAPTGGAKSIKHIPDIKVYQVATRYLTDPNTGKLESIKGSEKMLAIAEALKQLFASGKRPFETVVIDGVTSWNDIILSEIMGLNYDQMPAVLGLGKVTSDQYIERSERLIRYLRPLMDLPCDVTVLAQEKDHNPPKDTTTTRSGKEYTRPSQSRLMFEAHPMAQEGSFFSLGVSDTQAKWIQDACDFVMQLYDDDELVEEKSPDIVMNGQVVPGLVRAVRTGRQVKRLRCTYHPNYAARFREDYKNVPEYIEAPSPEERYAAFLDVVSGKRTKFGYYKQQ